jgi:dipeptidyl aminopeptidase/acylaminoacyl peptidase
LFTLIDSMPPYWEPYRDMYEELIGDPDKDSARMAEASPLYNVDQIKAPLFIAHGGKDVITKPWEANRIVDALRERDVDVVYMYREDEGHIYRKVENRMAFYKALTGFLDEKMPATNRGEKAELRLFRDR